MGEALMKNAKTNRESGSGEPVPVFCFSVGRARRDKMKYTVEITAENAIRDCGARAGIVSAEIDLAGFTAEERTALVRADKYRPREAANDSGWYYGYPFGVLDSEHLVRAVREEMSRDQKKKAEEAARLDRYVAQARETVARGEIPDLASWVDGLKEIVCAWPEYQALIEASNAVAAKKAADEQARRDAAEAEKKAAEQAETRERLAWIAANGSERLRRCVAEKISCLATYRDERLAAERPGWRWWDAVRGKDLDPRNPPAEAFDLLDEARAIAPDAELRFVEADAETDDETGDETAHEIRGYACLANFLGRQIVFGDLWD